MTGINGIQSAFIPNQSITKTEPTINKGDGFGEVFKKALNNVNQLQHKSDELTTKLLTGEVNDVSEVMIASQKASLSLQLTIQVRNKAVEAYQEVMRMQV